MVGTDYFSQGLPPSPVQHYWSLAIEEQFYLVWPVVLLAFASIRRAWSPRWATAAAVGAMALILGSSFWWSTHQTLTNPTVAYFSSLTRAWELGIGCLGAIYVRRMAAIGPRGAVVWESLAVVGAAGIAYSCLAFQPTTPFPGWLAAIPVMGALLVILAGARRGQSYLLGRVLSVPPLRTIGDWSYSLYLWHWPVLVLLTQYLGHTLTVEDKIAGFGLALVLAGLTYRYVENPLRRSAGRRATLRGLRWYPAAILITVSSAFLAGQISAHTGATDGQPITLPQKWRAKYHTDDAAEALVRASIATANKGGAIPQTLNPPLSRMLASEADVGACDYSDDTVRQLCPRGDVDADRVIVVFGNSHGRHWIPAFERIALDNGYRAYYLVKVQCVGSLVTPDMGTSSEPFVGCADFHRFALSQVRRLQPDLVVLTTSPTSRGVYDSTGTYFSERTQVDEIIEQGYVDLLRKLAAHSTRTVFLTDVPYLSGDPGTCLSSPRATLKSCLMHEHRRHLAAVQDQLDAAHAAGVEAIPTRQWFCWKEWCPTVIGEYLPYRDAGHLTNEYAESLAASLAARLDIGDPGNS
jgi:hypothetical protein